MTYVVGLEFGEMHSILCDTRGTLTRVGVPEGENVYLKSGLLFPGCIFGRVGNYRTSREFVLGAKYSLTPHNTLAGFWTEFREFAASYPYPTGTDSHFQILLSTRESGRPKFYILDSSTGLSEAGEGLITLGSGKRILDQMVHEDFRTRVQQIIEVAGDHLFGEELYPYLFSLWLSELSLTFEQSLLERHKVGGPFHFIFQVSGSEHTQKPSLLVFLDVDKVNRRVYWWQYRLAHVMNWLIVDAMIPPGQIQDHPMGKQDRIALLDEASLPPKKDGIWDPHELKRELDQIVEGELSKQPIYFFCGFGFTDQRYRTPFRFHATTEEDYVITEDGIRHDIMQLIMDDIASGQEDHPKS